LLLGLWWTQVRILHHNLNIHTILFTISQTSTNEVLSLWIDGRFAGELDFCGLEDYVLL